MSSLVATGIGMGNLEVDGAVLVVASVDDTQTDELPAFFAVKKLLSVRDEPRRKKKHENV